MCRKKKIEVQKMKWSLPILIMRRLMVINPPSRNKLTLLFSIVLILSKTTSRNEPTLLFSLEIILSKRRRVTFPEPSLIILLSQSKLMLLLKTKIVKVRCLGSFQPKESAQSDYANLKRVAKEKNRGLLGTEVTCKSGNKMMKSKVISDHKVTFNKT
jgi:hypothetical protein